MKQLLQEKKKRLSQISVLQAAPGAFPGAGEQSVGSGGAGEDNDARIKAKIEEMKRKIKEKKAAKLKEKIHSLRERIKEKAEAENRARGEDAEFDEAYDDTRLETF